MTMPQASANISVLLPTQNRARPLRRAIRSLQLQTITDFELLILDDASTDETPHLLRHLASTDSRIHVFRRNQSEGLASALNLLVEHSQGRWLARMDDDDLAHPRRLERQRAYMQSHGLDVVGTWYRRVTPLSRSVIRSPTEPSIIRAELLFQPPLLHPSAMLRREVFERYGGYRTDFPHAEDFDLWTRLAPTCQLGNVPEVLLDYTLSPRQVSRTHNRTQVTSARAIRAAYLRTLGIPHTAEQLQVHLHLRDPIPLSSLSDLRSAELWLLHLRATFPTEVAEVFARQWFLIAVRAAGLGLRTWKLWRASSLSAGTRPLNGRLLSALCAARVRYRSPLYRLLEPFASA
ncbi:MAG: glycosyltransferase family 2 protein [Gammaproteobacteria bacterium]|nr:glycosyltransferase family 2 protein [Gammaproteobacteria bacterium]